MEYNKRLEEIQQMFELNHDNEEPENIVLLCRTVLEKAIELIFDYSNVRKPFSASLLELINHETVQQFFGNDVMIDSLHFIRIVGINALHGKHIKKTQAKISYDNTKSLIDFLFKKIEQKVLDKTENKPVPEYLKKDLTEAETRSIYIDLYLNEAGWDVMEPTSKTQLQNGKSVKSGLVYPGKACSEIPVTGMKNVSGIGFCDYVLYGRDGKPLAIVEAKKTSVDPIVGQQQVREYGQCMKAQYGYTPILYYTNGYDIFIMDGKYPTRKIRSFHTMDELSFMIQNREKTEIKDMKIREDIAGRPYQKRAITSICERFNAMHRRGLLVMATGTGKTRTAIALVELLMRNHWIKNVLFLADRTSLVRQAFMNFSKLLPNESYTVLSDLSLANTPNARITFSTHQTMINKIDSETKEFSIGRFDLIIIDEAHRSIFNKYGSIFKYFDSLLVGLTATPKDEVDANTYSLFNCDSGVPNFSYSMEEAVRDKYLVPYRLVSRKTKLLTDGIAYKDLSEEDKAKLALISDEEFTDDSVISKTAIFKKIYNKDTCRRVLDDLMTIGMKVESGQKLGKTIIFAINHVHAVMIVETFEEMYPMYPNYCKLIDNQVKNSEDLIDEFETDPEFRIAVSVDMLDTGIDIPSVLNLVFFKRINSNIKLVQMIGRGTRLCPGLLDGKDKHCFYILDYFNNFKGPKLELGKSILTIAQKLFAVRLDMMCMLQNSEHQSIAAYKEYYNELKKILIEAVKRIKATGSSKIGVREQMSIVDKYCEENRWKYISTLDFKEILYALQPLIESDVSENYLCLSFDYKMLQIEHTLIAENSIAKSNNIIKNIRMIVQELLNQASIDEIYNHISELNTLYSEQFWKQAKVEDIEYYRKNIRSLMKYLDLKGYPFLFISIDTDDISSADSAGDNPLIDVRTYKEKVMDYLLENTDNPTIKKIKNMESLNDDDFTYLEDVLWTKLGNKKDYYSISKIDNLAIFIRSLVGIDQEAINEKFSQYLDDNRLNSVQQEFIYSIINYVQENGDVEIENLINESPFDHFDILELFGSDVQIVTKVVNQLHNCVQA